MTGPDLSLPAPGSNAVGLFAIGQSPVGDLPAFDPWKTVISQYANSPAITTLIQNFFAYVDQTANFQAFFEDVVNIDTAQGWGLDVWGRILAVNRVLHIPIGPKYFGFDEGGTLDYDNFGPGGVSPFYSGQALTQNYVLTDPGFRVLLLAKAFSNICDGSIVSINRLLVTLFGASGRCYVVDDGGMAFTYKFEFTLTPLQEAILVQSGVMPRPTGV
ncbi:MAG TPA: DUF2612 domain-containing protein, partial [Gaiellaceae bacterium]